MGKPHGDLENAVRQSLALARRKSKAEDTAPQTLSAVAREVRRRSIAQRLHSWSSDVATVACAEVEQSPEVDETMLEQAVKSASRRHRASVSRAVESATKSIDGREADSEEDYEDDTCVGRVHRAVREAFFAMHHLYLMGE